MTRIAIQAEFEIADAQADEMYRQALMILMRENYTLPTAYKEIGTLDQPNWKQITRLHLQAKPLGHVRPWTEPFEIKIVVEGA